MCHFQFQIRFLDTLTTLDAKVVQYSPEGNLWRYIGKMENFGDIWWSILSLCIINVVEFNLNFSRKFRKKLNVNQKFEILWKIRSITVRKYSSYVMLLGKYSSWYRNLWRSTKHEWLVSLSIGCQIQITLKYFHIQRVIGGKDIKSEIYRQKKKAKILDTNIQKLSSMSSYSSPLISINGSVFSHTSALHWKKSVQACSDLLQRQRLVEQFPKN